MSENRKIFLKGMAVGMIAVIWLNIMGNGIMFAYRRFVPAELAINQKIELIFAILDHAFVGEFDRADVENALFAGMLYGVGDRYTTYMSPAEFKRFTEVTEGTYVGIGAVVTRGEDGSVVIVSPYYGSPAYNAGLLPGDRIRKIDGVDVTNYELSAAISMIQGVENTSVTVTVHREIENSVFDLDIIRQRIEVPTIAYEMMEDNIGFIRISGFEGVTYSQFVQAYESLVSQGMEGLIIDVRNNPGGLLHIVINIANMLVPEGIIVYTEDAQGNRQVQYSDERQIEVPLAVLINGNSASASEVLSGAIKDHGVGVLVGEQSFGKGLVQNIFPLPDGSAIKVTIATYYTPNGISIHGEGLTPHYVIPMEPSMTSRINALTLEEDIQLQEAFDIVQRQIQN